MRTSHAYRRVAYLVAGLAVLAFLMWRLADHMLDWRTSEPFDFTVGETALAGTLWYPEENARAAVVIVHGDGAQDRTSGGGYAPFINTLLDRGIAVAAWDKPGVGASSGNWLDQTMEDRAIETREALAILAKRMEGRSVGALGFSQAGWVLPRLTRRDADFVVLVGAAVSWRDQNAYYTRTRLRLSGMNDADMARALSQMADKEAEFFAADAEFDPTRVPEGMSEARWEFVRRNRDENARGALERMDMPVFALWGEEDLNVNPTANVAIYRRALIGRDPESRVLVVPEAMHGLLKAAPYNAQLVDQWSWFTMLRFMGEGRHAYAPGVLDEIGEWILDRVNRHARIDIGDRRRTRGYRYCSADSPHVQASGAWLATASAADLSSVRSAPRWRIARAATP